LFIGHNAIEPGFAIFSRLRHAPHYTIAVNIAGSFEFATLNLIPSMQALEARRVTASSDLLHAGEYVFIESGRRRRGSARNTN
jgi:hypothetical protein